MLRAGIAAYIVAFAAFIVNLALDRPEAGSRSLVALIMGPIMIPLAALVFSPLVFLTSMLWGLAPIDFSAAKWALKRNHRAAWGVVLLLSAALAFIGALSRQS